MKNNGCAQCFRESHRVARRLSTSCSSSGSRTDTWKPATVQIVDHTLPPTCGIKPPAIDKGIGVSGTARLPSNSRVAARESSIAGDCVASLLAIGKKRNGVRRWHTSSDVPGRSGRNSHAVGPAELNGGSARALARSRQPCIHSADLARRSEVSDTTG